MRSGRRWLVGPPVGAPAGLFPPVVLLLAVTLALVTGCSADPESADADPAVAVPTQEAPTQEAPSPEASPGTLPGPTGTGRSEGRGADRGEPGQGETDGGESEEGGAEEGGAEVPVPEASDSAEGGLPGVDPPREPGPLVEAPLPAAATARDRLVDGFPPALRPLRRSSVVSSSLSPAGSRLQVALEATTTLGTAAVLRGYRSRLTAHRMAEEPAAAVPGSEAVGFRRGDDALVVTVRREAGLTAYTVFGVLRAGGA